MTKIFSKMRTILKVFFPESIITLYSKVNLQIRKKKLLKECSNIKNHIKNKSPLFCVTLTSYGSRVTKTTPYTIASILNQDVLPDKVILWLAFGTRPPPIYDQLISRGLEIRYCEDIRSYKKLIPALESLPEDILITADDDVLYPRDWMTRLIRAYEKYPNCIQGFRCHAISLTSQGEVRPYSQWKKDIDQTDSFPEFAIFPTGVNGVIYPPQTLDRRCLNRDLFMRIAPSADDIWFWAMGRLNGTEYKVIQHELKYFDQVDSKQVGLFETINKDGGNDNQFQMLTNEFPQLLEMLRDKYRYHVE